MFFFSPPLRSLPFPSLLIPGGKESLLLAELVRIESLSAFVDRQLGRGAHSNATPSLTRSSSLDVAISQEVKLSAYLALAAVKS